MRYDVRFHGRGGQGVVTAAELLSLAAFDQGRHAQALPSFGSERTGAPVIAYCRLDDRPIRSHDPVAAPDAVVVQDPTMLHLPGVLDDLAPGGLLLVNSARDAGALGLGDGAVSTSTPDQGVRVVTVPASDLARARLGRPLPNTALLGALAALSGAVTLRVLQEAIRRRFSGSAGELNALLASDGWKTVEEVPGHAHAG